MIIGDLENPKPTSAETWGKNPLPKNHLNQNPEKNPYTLHHIEADTMQTSKFSHRLSPFFKPFWFISIFNSLDIKIYAKFCTNPRLASKLPLDTPTESYIN